MYKGMSAYEKLLLEAETLFITHLKKAKFILAKHGGSIDIDQAKSISNRLRSRDNFQDTLSKLPLLKKAIKPSDNNNINSNHYNLLISLMSNLNINSIDIEKIDIIIERPISIYQRFYRNEYMELCEKNKNNSKIKK